MGTQVDWIMGFALCSMGKDWWTMPALYSYLRLSLAGIMHALLLFEIEYFYLKRRHHRAYTALVPFWPQHGSVL